MPHKDRLVRNAYVRRWHGVLRTQMLKRFGSRCKSCGNTDHRVLQIDHIKGGGTRDQRSTAQLYRYVLSLSARPLKQFQLLCANCNWIKKYENQEVRQSL